MPKLSITAENAEALFKRGLIKEGTYQRIQKLASGGTVAPVGNAPDVEQMLKPSVDELAKGAKQMAAAMPDQTASKYEALKNNFQNSWLHLSPEDSEKLAVEKLAKEKEAKDQSTLLDQEKAKASAEEQSQLNEKKAGLGLAPSSNGAPAAPAPRGPSEGVQLEPAHAQAAVAPTDQMLQGYMNSQREIGKALDMQGEAALMGAKAGAAGAAAQSKYLQDLSLNMDQLEKQRQASENLRQQKAQEANERLSQSIEDFQKKAVVDPNRYWAEKSTGSKIGMAIGLFFSGANGSHHAFDMLDNAINRDVDAQKTALSAKQAGIQMQTNVYKNMLDQFGDQRQAELASKQALMGIAEIKIKQVMAGTQNVQALAQGQAALAEIGLKKAQMGQEFMKTVLTSPAFMAQDDRLKRVLMMSDPHVKETGLKELSEYDKHQQTLSGVEQAFQTMAQNRRAIIPGTQSYSQSQAAEAKILSLTSELFSGKSENEFKIVPSLLPKPTDNQETLNWKIDQLKQKIESQASFPILTGMGIVKKPLPLVRK